MKEIYMSDADLLFRGAPILVRDNMDMPWNFGELLELSEHDNTVYANHVCAIAGVIAAPIRYAQWKPIPFDNLTVNRLYPMFEEYWKPIKSTPHTLLHNNTMVVLNEV